jgi:Ca2+-binding EF-hand superfamily protein
MKKIFAALMIILFAAVWSFAADDLFSKIDANKDGKISKQEYMDATAATFRKLDKNKDGFLTKDELKVLDKIDAQRFLKEVDINKDGKISQDEFNKAAEKRFKFLDKNNDDFIDRKEWNNVKDDVNQKNSKSVPVFPLMIFSF